jgi:hypothetical protein
VDLFILVIHDESDPEIEVYNDLNRLLGGIEPPEAKEGAYTVYDSGGRRALLSADTRRWDVAVDSWEDGQAVHLREAVARRFANQNLGIDWDQLPLPDLMARLTTELGIGPHVEDVFTAARSWFRELLHRRPEK